MAHWKRKMNLTRKHEVAGLIPDLVQWVKDPLLPAMSCGIGHRLRSGVAVAVAVAGSCSSD